MSKSIWGILLGLTLIPLLWQVGPWLEHRFFPVVEDVEIHDPTVTEDGVSFFVSFEKVRQCEFVGVAWYSGAVRVGVEFAPGHNLYPATRPEGDQFAGPWLVRDVSTLEGTRAAAIHRCHPLWQTVSQFYPPQDPPWGSITAPLSIWN